MSTPKARPPRKARAARRKPDSVSRQLREIILGRRDLTPYAIATAAEVAPSTLTRFMHDERTMSLETLDAIAPVLGLKLTETRRGRSAGKAEAKGGV